MGITPEDLRAALDRAFPVRTSALEISFPGDESITAGPEGLTATMHARALEPGEPPTLLEEAARAVLLVRRGDLDTGHLEAYVQGWALALARALAGVESLQFHPRELVFAELLADASLTTADAFADALADPARLGGLGRPGWEERALRFDLEELGLAAHADALATYITPSLRLWTGEPDDELPPGASRIGGVPDVEADFVWPRCGGLPMSFIAQLDLAEVAERLDGPLPRRGALYFFYDAEQRAAGFDPEDRGSWRVIHDPRAGASSQRAAPPADLPERALFPARALSLSREQTVPPLGSPHYDALAGPLDLATLQPFAAFVACYGANADPEGIVHRLLGHPEPVQGDMYTECQLVTHGIYCGDSRHADDPRVPALQPGALEWQLLLQVDTEDVDTMMWGDGGRLYFWIRREDLAAGDFDAVWVILQGH